MSAAETIARQRESSKENSVTEKHTPAPWSLHARPNRGTWNIFHHGDAPAHVGTFIEGSAKRGDANAEFICRAVNAYADAARQRETIEALAGALREVLSWNEDDATAGFLTHSAGKEITADIFAARSLMLRAALSKLEGRAP